MKKGILYISLALLSLQACRKENTVEDPEKITTTIEEQNAIDDEAIVKYMETHYFDSRGNVRQFNETDTSDDNEPNLATYNPVTLPSGVVYIIRPGAQPNPGKTIGNDDVLHLMGSAYTYVPKKNNNEITFEFSAAVVNTINAGNILIDPFFYYAKEENLTANNVTKDFYEIEGFQEGIRKFKSCEIPEEENYNLQGVILVPSRAAYGRKDNVYTSNVSKFYDRSFVFNFQIYKTTER